MIEESDNRLEIELLKKDVVTMSALLTKFDVALSKMQEIATSLSRMVSLQEQRLENQETVTREMQSVLEMRRIEHNQEIKDLHSRITTVNRELTEKIENTEKTILTELHEMREELRGDNKGFSSRLGHIEAWKYGVVMVFIILAWIAGQTDIISKLLK